MPRTTNAPVCNIHLSHLAWGDESVRISCNPPVYLIGASYYLDNESADLQSLESMLPSGAKKLHWRDMNDSLRQKSIVQISELQMFHIVVVATNLKKKKQERARRKCLETLLPILESKGIERLTLESRGSVNDRRDTDLLLCTRRKQAISTIDLRHNDGKTDHHLWIPDQILGAYGDYLQDQTARPLPNQLLERMTTIEIPL